MPENDHDQDLSAPAPFGERLRRARNGQKRTLRQVASSAGVSIAYLSDLERGVLQNPTLDKLRAIAAALNVSLNDLLGVPGPAPNVPLAESSTLREFTAGALFQEATEKQAERLRADPDDLRLEWVEALRGIDLGGLRPQSAADYSFIFEAIRHAIEPR